MHQKINTILYQKLKFYISTILLRRLYSLLLVENFESSRYNLLTIWLKYKNDYLIQTLWYNFLFQNKKNIILTSYKIKKDVDRHLGN